MTTISEWVTMASSPSSLLTDDWNTSSTTSNPSLVLTAGAKRSLQVYDVLIPALGILIIIGNLVVVISSGLILKGAKAQPRTTYLFLGNMAIADLVTGVAVLFGQYFPREHRNSFICILQLGMIVSATMASIWSVGLIAVDRFLFIVHGLRYRSWLYPGRARVLILLTWILGILVGFLPAMGWSDADDNGRVCWYIRQYPPALILITSAVGGIPIFVVIILYSIILYYAVRKAIQLRRADRRDADIHNNDSIRVNRPAGAAKENAPSKWKAVMIVALTTGSFVVTWVPYFVACSMYVVCVGSRGRSQCRSLEVAIAAPLAILGFVNSLLNPVIYAWWHTGFRGLVAKMMCRKRGTDAKGLPNVGRTMTKTSFMSTSMTSVSGSFGRSAVGEEVTTKPLEDVDLRV